MLERASLRQTSALDVLAEASRILATSPDLSEALQQVAALCARQLGDYCSIVAQTPEGEEFHAEQTRDSSFDLRKAKTVIERPLFGRQATIGTFTLAAREPEADEESVQRLADVLSLQIATAIDQAGLFARTYRVADRLQRALLPDTFPRVPGGRLDGAYRPAGDEAEVGGDWYDGFALPDGRIAISMGDVAGHGLEAAIVMGEVRQAMRAAAVGEQSPAAVLEHVNSVVSSRAGIGMVTGIFAYYEPRTRELTYAVAGHPSPALIVVDGFSGFLPGGGLPLGIGDSIGAVDWLLTIPPRSWVVFYTDGMIEYGRDVLAGEERLLEGCRDSCGAENPATALQERIFESTPNRDDAATLVLSCFDGVVPDRVVFSAIPLSAPIIRSVMHRFCDQENLTPDQRFSLVSAVGEAVANSIEHAYRGEDRGEIEIRLDADADRISIDVADHGHWRTFKKQDERGRGIILMHELMDRVRITSAQKGTVLSLMLRRHGSAGAVAAS